MFDDLSCDGAAMPQNAVLIYQRESKLIRLVRLPMEIALERIARSETDRNEQGKLPIDIKSSLASSFVVVKMFKSSNSDIAASFHREVSSLAKLRGSSVSASVERNDYRVPQQLHSHCCQKEATAADAAELVRYCILTEYVRAVPLQKLFLSGEFKTKLPRAFVASVIAQAAIVLSTQVHAAAGLVVRDVKLPNLLLDPRTGKLHLVDFGCAAPSGSQEKADLAPIGTVHVRAPEMYRPCSSSQSTPFNAAHPSCDVYALGCALVELLTGAPAFGSFDSSEASEPRNNMTAVADVVRSVNASGNKKNKFSEIDAAAAELLLVMLHADPKVRLGWSENGDAATGWHRHILAAPFFLMAAKQHIDEGTYKTEKEDDENPPMPISNLSAPTSHWSLADWSNLCLDVIRSYENLEEELDLQLLGM